MRRRRRKRRSSKQQRIAAAALCGSLLVALAGVAVGAFRLARRLSVGLVAVAERLRAWRSVRSAQAAPADTASPTSRPAAAPEAPAPSTSPAWLLLGCRAAAALTLAAATATGWLLLSGGSPDAGLGGFLAAAAAMAAGVPLSQRWQSIRRLPSRLMEAVTATTEDKRGLDPTLWKQARRDCFAVKGRTCHIRLKRCTRMATQIDHIVPLARGGDKYALSNLQPSCRHCNLSKGTKLMSELPGAFLRSLRRRHAG